MHLIHYRVNIERWWERFISISYNLEEIPFAVKKSGSSSGRFWNATLVRLSEFLSAGYKKGVRPVKDWRTSTTVAIDLMVYSILNVVGLVGSGRSVGVNAGVSRLCSVSTG